MLSYLERFQGRKSTIHRNFEETSFEAVYFNKIVTNIHDASKKNGKDCTLVNQQFCMKCYYRNYYLPWKMS